MMWIPSGVDADSARTLCTPTELWAQDREGLADFRNVRLFLQHVGETAPARLASFGASSEWSTITPYAPPRHIRSDGRMLRSLHAQVSRDLAEVGKPDPVKIDILDGRPHALDYRRHRVNERLSQARRAFHIRLTFSEPVRGPISIGALSHFGLGHFLPGGGAASLASFSPATERDTEDTLVHTERSTLAL